jgi:hypothetical protein
MAEGGERFSPQKNEKMKKGEFCAALIEYSALKYALP